jgi:outer membrane protein assembly factor BamB
MSRFSNNVKKKTPSTYKNPYGTVLGLAFCCYFTYSCGSSHQNSEIGGSEPNTPNVGHESSQDSDSSNPSTPVRDIETPIIEHSESNIPDLSPSAPSTIVTLPTNPLSDRGGPGRPGGVSARAPRQQPRLAYRLELNGEIRASLAATGSSVVFATRNGRVIAIDPSDGRTLWKAATLAIRGSGPAIGDDALFVAEIGRTGRLIALELDSGRERWTQKIGPTSTSLNLTSQGLVVATTKELGGVAAFEQRTGERRWHRPLPGWLDSPTVADDLVIMATESGILAVGVDDGSDRWRVKLAGTPSPPALLGERMVTTFEEGGLACLGVDGELRWTRSELRPIPGLAALNATRAFVISGDELMAFELDSGRVAWRAPAMAGTSPSVAGDVIIALASRQELVAYDASDGTQLWTLETERPIGALPLFTHGKLFVPLRVDMDGQADLLVYGATP